MSLSSSDEVRDLYEGSADSYNQMMEQEILLPVYHEVLSNLASKLKTVAGSILDSSCGTGHMLERIRDEYLPGRELIGVDISPKMVAFSRNRLGESATVIESDMGKIPQQPNDSCAAVLSFFAIQHVDLEGFQRCLGEWKRVLVSGGHLLIAAWEGDGAVDYGEVSNVVAKRYRESEVVDAANSAGFSVTTHTVKPVEDFDMDAIYVFATKELRG
ncbi:class I SAM-dependent methyltransferase [bacterium]|nr:class I SAM-dependent methyltransferase [bacterium]